MGTSPEEDLLRMMQDNAGSPYDAWARHELERRRMVDLQGISISLLKATNTMTQGVIVVAESSGRLETLTASLVTATDGVQKGVTELANSSGKLEELTVKLNRLTWVLIFLTALAAVVPLGVELWKAGRETNALLPPNSRQPLPPASPQTPQLPGR